MFCSRSPNGTPPSPPPPPPPVSGSEVERCRLRTTWLTRGEGPNGAPFFHIFVQLTFIETQGAHMVSIYQPYPPFRGQPYL